MSDVGQFDQGALVLEMSRSWLRAIFEVAPVAVLSVDESQTIVEANPAAAAMFGYAADALVGGSLERIIPSRFRSAHGQAMRVFGEPGDVSRRMGRMREVVGLRADGAEFPVDAAISCLRAGGKRLYTAMLRDLTQRPQGDAALHDSEASLRRILVTLPEAVVVNSGNRISYVNEAAQRLFGANEAALLGRAPLELFHPGSIQVAKARLAALIAGDAVTPLVELRMLRADGGTLLVESTETLIRDRDTTSIVMVLRDVTELERARDALAHSHADLQRLIGAQDRIQEDERKRIARELHDDLQQTLAAIRIDLGSIGAQLTHDPASVAPVLAEVDRLAQAAIDSTRRILNDLRPQMLEDLGLVPALETLMVQFGRRTGIMCRLEAGAGYSDVGAMSPSIASCLYRVAQEALGNVARHAQASEVRVRCSRLPHGQVMLQISDNGVGMIVGQRRKPQSFGLLGMYERVRAVGGHLRIDSQPGSGTTIEVVVAEPTDTAVWRRSADAAPSGPHAAEHARAGAKAPTLPAHSDLDAGGAGAADPSPAGPWLQSVIDALPDHIAVLDRQGAIRFVNRAWRAFAEHNGDPGMRTCGPGANYVEACLGAAQVDPLARRTLAGLNSVLDGSRAAFKIVYPCHSPDRRRWFRMHAAAMAEGHVLVTHVDLTGWVDPERISDPFAEGD